MASTISMLVEVFTKNPIIFVVWVAPYIISLQKQGPINRQPASNYSVFKADLDKQIRATYAMFVF